MSPAPMQASGPRRAWTALALALYLAMLVWAAVPGQEQQLFGQTSDKLLHFGAYGLIAGGVFLGEPGTVRQRAARTVALVAMLGGLDEAIQSLQAHRTPDWSDWATDLLAAVTVSVVALAESKRRSAGLARRFPT